MADASVPSKLPCEATRTTESGEGVLDLPQRLDGLEGALLAALLVHHLDLDAVVAGDSLGHDGEAPVAQDGLDLRQTG